MDFAKTATALDHAFNSRFIKSVGKSCRWPAVPLKSPASTFASLSKISSSAFSQDASLHFSSI
jgi:hypothetical protein